MFSRRRIEAIGTGVVVVVVEVSCHRNAGGYELQKPDALRGRCSFERSEKADQSGETHKTEEKR